MFSPCSALSCTRTSSRESESSEPGSKPFYTQTQTDCQRPPGPRCPFDASKLQTCQGGGSTSALKRSLGKPCPSQQRGSRARQVCRIHLHAQADRRWISLSKYLSRQIRELRCPRARPSTKRSYGSTRLFIARMKHRRGRDCTRNRRSFAVNHAAARGIPLAEAPEEDKATFCCLWVGR